MFCSRVGHTHDRNQLRVRVLVAALSLSLSYSVGSCSRGRPPYINERPPPATTTSTQDTQLKCKHSLQSSIAAKKTLNCGIFANHMRQICDDALLFADNLNICSPLFYVCNREMIEGNESAVLMFCDPGKVFDAVTTECVPSPFDPTDCVLNTTTRTGVDPLLLFHLKSKAERHGLISVQKEQHNNQLQLCTSPNPKLNPLRAKRGSAKCKIDLTRFFTCYDYLKEDELKVDSKVNVCADKLKKVTTDPSLSVGEDNQCEYTVCRPWCYDIFRCWKRNGKGCPGRCAADCAKSTGASALLSCMCIPNNCFEDCIKATSSSTVG